MKDLKKEKENNKESRNKDNKNKTIEKENKYKAGFFKQFYLSTFNLKNSYKIVENDTKRRLYAAILLQVVTIIVTAISFFLFLKPSVETVNNVLYNSELPSISSTNTEVTSDIKEKIITSGKTKIIIDTNISDFDKAIKKYVSNYEDRLNESEKEEYKNEKVNMDGKNTNNLVFIIKSGMYVVNKDIPGFIVNPSTLKVITNNVSGQSFNMTSALTAVTLGYYIVFLLLFWILYQIILKTIGLILLKMYVAMKKSKLKEEEIYRISTYAVTIPMSLLLIWVVTSLIKFKMIVAGADILGIVIVAYIITISIMKMIVDKRRDKNSN